MRGAKGELGCGIRMALEDPEGDIACITRLVRPTCCCDDRLTMLFRLEFGTVVGLAGTGGGGTDCPLVLSAGRFVLEDIAGWLERGVELA